MPRLRVQFDDPHHGWIGLLVQSGEQRFHDCMSYTPFDSFTELVTVLLNLVAEGDDGRHASTVNWSGQPHRYEFRFDRGKDGISLRVVEFPNHRRIEALRVARFGATGSYEDVCLPFWKALRDLQGRLTDEEISARWHRNFPSSAMWRLTECVRDRRR